MTDTSPTFEQIGRELAAAYRQGRDCARSASAIPETTVPDTVREGDRRRREVMSRYLGRHSASGMRVFAVYDHPPQRNWWLTDLFSTLKHVGVPYAWATAGDQSLSLKIDVFRPTVVLGAETAGYLASPAPGIVAEYKRARGCLRLFNPPRPGRDQSGRLDAGSRDRLSADLDGSAADAHFLPFVGEHYRRIFPEWDAAGFPYFPFLAAADLRTHHPVDAAKDLDYFIACSPDPRRPERLLEYLAPIMRRHHGLWAGQGWGFGEGRVAPSETPLLYARARVAPNPLHASLVEHPGDVTHRTFAAIACGGFVITDRTPITDRFFAANELVAVTGADEFADAFEHFVERPQERDAYVRRGMRRVFAEHTTFHRVDELVRFWRRHPDLV